MNIRPDELSEAIQPLLNILQSLPAIKPSPMPFVFEVGSSHCRGCGVKVANEDIVKVTSPYTYAGGTHTLLDISCQSCRRNTKDFAMIACPRTRIIVAKIAPHTDLSGFKFEKNHIYHVDNSPETEVDGVAKWAASLETSNQTTTNGGIALKSIILEKKLYDDKHRTKAIISNSKS